MIRLDSFFEDRQKKTGNIRRADALTSLIRFNADSGYFHPVIPREGGNPEAYTPAQRAAILRLAAILAGENVLDSRLRGNDEGFCVRGKARHSLKAFLPLLID
jgi:hypothetical protein